MKTQQLKFWSVGLSLTMMSTLGCTRTENTDIDGISLQSGVQASRNMNEYPLNKLVCNPMGGDQPKMKNGIEASLAYRGAGQPRWYSVLDYLNLGVKSDKKLFYTDLNVPTRMFSTGFATQTSSVVTNDAGETLIEYFGMRFKTELRLKEGQAAGNYDLAVLADDGVRVSLLDARGKTELINGDGDNSTKMNCGGKLEMLPNVGRTLEIEYYQGPRYHIALMMLWRPAQEGPLDPQCGKRGTQMYFNAEQGSTPQQAYLDLLARGWKPIEADNYFLPDQVVVNPCYPGNPLEMGDVRVAEVFFDQVEITWFTSRPATSQVFVKDMTTGVETLTASDNMLRTTHSLVVTGLQSGRTYQFRAVSLAEDGGRAISEPFSATLP